MARTIAQIRVSFINSLVSTAAALGITIDPSKWISVPGSLSQTDQKLLLLNTCIDAQSIQEQLYDAFQLDVEAKLKIVPPQNAPWFQNRAINVFQFNSLVPQIPSLVSKTVYIQNGGNIIKNNDGTITLKATPYSIEIPSFNPIIESYKIIKYCSVIFAQSGRVLIKIAGQSNNLPVQIDSLYSGALAAYQSFVNTDAAAGISYVAISYNADQLFSQIDLYYNGAYSAVIFDNVKNAITTFLNNIDFNGVFLISSLQSYIKSVEGVLDVVFVNLGARQDSVPFSSAYTFGYNLVFNNTEIQRSWSTIAGYIKLEETSGKTLSDFRVGSSGALNLNCIPL